MSKRDQIQSILLIALPLMAAFLAQRGMQFIDTLMMGWLGPSALAAGILGTSIFMTLLIFSMGVLSAIGVFIVRAKGEERITEIPMILQQGFGLAFFLSIPCMLILWFTPHFLLAIGQDPLVVANTARLLHGLLWGLPGFLLFLVLREFIAAYSLTVVIMMISLLSIPLTFIVNYILIYGKYGFPTLGIAGIGYGGAVVMWFMFLCLLIYAKKHPLLKNPLTISSIQLNYHQFRDILHVGLPSGVLFLLEAGMFLSTAILMGYFGITALAAHQIAMQCVNIAYTLPTALSMATALQISHAVGSKNIVQAKHTAIASFTIVLFTSILLAILFVCFSNPLVQLFLENQTTQTEAVYQLAITFIHIAALFLCFDALQSVANGALRGLKDTFVPMLLSIICYWLLGVGGAYYLSLHTSLGAEGIWYGLTLGLCSTAIILLVRFFKKIDSMKQSNR